MAPNLIVCLTGMPGAGKSTIANGLKSQGFDVVVMGNAVRSEADKRNLEHNRENLASLMVTLRASDGPAAIAHLVEPEIQNATSDTVIVDGVRSDDEIAFFETICTTKILSVHASKDTRFNYMTNRGRSDDPQNKSKFTELVRHKRNQLHTCPSRQKFARIHLGDCKRSQIKFGALEHSSKASNSGIILTWPF